jgi:hypothetical protein
MFLSEESPSTFPTDLLKRPIDPLKRYKCHYNYFLPAGVYPNTAPRGVYDIECLSIFIAFPLIRKKNFSFMEGRKAEEELLRLKRIEDRNFEPQFGPQCLFEYHYPKRNTYDLDAVPTAKQLMFSRPTKKGKKVLIVDQVWVAIYPKKSESRISDLGYCLQYSRSHEPILIYS